MRHVALAYLGINPTKPAIEFDLRVPKAAISAVAVANTRIGHDGLASRYRVL
jgi:hypothetical protein